MKLILVTCNICISKPPFKSPFYRFQLQILSHQGTPFKFSHIFIYILIQIIWKRVHGCIVKMVNEWANFACSICMPTSHIIGKMKILQDLLRTTTRKCVLNISVSNSIISILVMRNTRQFINGHDTLLQGRLSFCLMQCKRCLNIAVHNIVHNIAASTLLLNIVFLLIKIIYIT